MKTLILRRSALAALPLLLSACASLPPDGGRADLGQLLSARGEMLPEDKAEAEIAALVASKMATPLSAAEAVAIAYLQNPRLRAAYARLGLAAADVYDAGRLSNPRLSVEILFGSHLSGDELTFGLSQSFTDLLFLGKRSKIAGAAYASATAAAAQDILDVAAEVQTAYVRLVAAQQTALMRAKIADAARVGSELAGRFHDAGNINRLTLAIEQAAASEARLASLAAEAEAQAARDDLNRLMGFRAAASWTVTAELQLPDAADAPLDGIIAGALDARLDLVARREGIRARVVALGLSRDLRWLNGADISAAHQREDGDRQRSGPALSVELPIFNSGKGRVARARAELQRAASDLADAELAVLNSLRAGAARLTAARARAEEYGATLVPLRAAIVARMQEEVNFMLRGPFDLLRARNDEYEASDRYMAALGDYWIARVDLARLAGGRLPDVAAETPASDIPAAMDHDMQHHMDHGDHQ
ncbi:TolC family protein [Govanella unica]|uniref:TolC family protein n=1 Tax=Govanella unica TaxID=2975056 RepID=A0A9X3Z871_9PROT|nr:TolC family protein [Govania unica]MDA5194734.1 TolC family protein [Govania unica]